MLIQQAELLNRAALSAEGSSRMPGEQRLEDAGILAKGASVSLTGGMAAQGLSMLGQILMARFLGAAEFGLYSVGWTLVRLVPSVTTLGLEAGVTYFGARYLRSNGAKFKGVVKESITIACLSGVTIGAALYIAAPALAQHVFQKPDVSPVIRAFAPAFPLYAVLLVTAAVTRLSRRMQYAIYSGVGLTASALVLFCILFVLGFGLRGAVFSTVGGIAVGALMSVCFVAFLFPSVFAKGPRPEWVGGKLLAYSAPLVLSGLAASMLAFVDRFFVASFCSSADMGVYQAASQLSILFSIAYGAFDNIFAPMVADLHARGEKARLAELYRICAKWGFYASAPVFLVILFAPGDLVKFVYGNAYVQAATPLVILSFGKVVMMTTAASGPVLLMTGRQKMFVAIPLAVLPIDLLLNFFLVPAFGLAGAASAAAISALILNAATILAVRKEVGIWPFDARYVKAAIATSAAFGLLYILPPFEIRVPALRLFVIAGISLAAFAGCLVALGLDTEDREVLGIVRARVRWPLVPSRSSCRL